MNNIKGNKEEGPWELLVRLRIISDSFDGVSSFMSLGGWGVRYTQSAVSHRHVGHARPEGAHQPTIIAVHRRS